MQQRLAASIRITLALVMIAPLVVMADPLPNTFFPFIVGKALYARTLTEIAFGLWVILILRDSSYRIPTSWFLPIFGIYVLIALLATVFGVSPNRSMWSTYERMQGWVDLVHWFTFVLVLVATHRTWAHWRALFNFNIGVSIIMGLLGLIQYFDVGTLKYLQSTTRLEITLGNPTYVGGYMMVNVFIAMALLTRSFIPRRESEAAPRSTERRRHRRARRRESESRGVSTVNILRAYWFGAILLDFVIFYLTGTRGAMFGLVMGVAAFGIGYMLWGNVRRLRIAAMVATAVVVVLVAAVGVAVVVRAGGEGGGVTDSNGMLDRVLNTGLADSSFDGRIDSAQVGLNGFRARPILGWGPENFAIVYDRYLTPQIVAVAVTSFDQAHNKLIEELTTKGALGFLAYMGLWVYMAVIVIRKAKYLDSSEQLFTIMVGAALVGYFSQNLFLFDTPGTVPQFYILMGLMVFVDSLVIRGVEGEPNRNVTLVGETEGRGPLFPSLTSQMGMGSAIAVVAVLIFSAIYLLNIRPYAGSSLVLTTLNASLPWETRFQAFENSVDAFPPLGNLPRRVMFNEINRRWDTLKGDDVVAALEAIGDQGKAGIIAEPEEWRIYNAVAGLYQRVAHSDTVFMNKARELVDEAVKLAPARIEVQRLLIRQHLIEEDYTGALQVIEDYVTNAPEAATHFRDLLEDIERVHRETINSRQEG